MSLLAFVTIEGLMLIGVWVGSSNIWQTTNEASRIHGVLRGQGSHKISDRSNFRSFHFRVQKAHNFMKYPKIFRCMV